jgi:hypothetical protein
MTFLMPLAAGRLSIINSVLGSSYVIRYNGTSDVALEFSGLASIQPGGRASITNAPVEEGKYQSINKVREPRRVRCAIIIDGLTGYSGSIPDIFSFTLTSQSDACGHSGDAENDRGLRH